MTASARSELLFSKAMRGDLSVEAETTLPTRHGLFRCIVFRHAEDWTKEHVAMVMGDVAGDDTLLRVHSECLTSEVFGSLKCDCADQLDLALESIAAHGRGNMPPKKGGSLSQDEYNAIIAFDLKANGVDLTGKQVNADTAASFVLHP